MRYFDARRNAAYPVSLTVHQALAQHKSCNQRESAIAWAHISVWVHRNLVQFLPYYMLNFRTPIISGQLGYFPRKLTLGSASATRTAEG